MVFPCLLGRERVGLALYFRNREILAYENMDDQSYYAKKNKPDVEYQILQDLLIFLNALKKILSSQKW